MLRSTKSSVWKTGKSGQRKTFDKETFSVPSCLSVWYPDDGTITGPSAVCQEQVLTNSVKFGSRQMNTLNPN
ncbi:hypothetical protein GJ496_001928 [Pomphorhynchus laevis]|nr:hypothetical protein GJ496_001928 [Pomphorhynchus laevis]